MRPKVTDGDRYNTDKIITVGPGVNDGDRYNTDKIITVGPGVNEGIETIPIK